MAAERPYAGEEGCAPSKCARRERPTAAASRGFEERAEAAAGQGWGRRTALPRHRPGPPPHPRARRVAAAGPGGRGRGGRPGDAPAMAGGGHHPAAARRPPLDLQLQIGAMVRLGIGQRNGAWCTLDFPHRIEHEERFDGLHSVERWLWPDGWGSRRGRWHLIPEALWTLTRNARGWFHIPGVGRVAMFVSVNGRNTTKRPSTDPLRTVRLD